MSALDDWQAFLNSIPYISVAREDFADQTEFETKIHICKTCQTDKFIVGYCNELYQTYIKCPNCDWSFGAHSG